MYYFLIKITKKNAKLLRDAVSGILSANILYKPKLQTLSTSFNIIIVRHILRN